MPTPFRSARQLAVACARIAGNMKAADVVVLDIGPFLQLTDYFVIATGTNPRHLRATAEEIIRTLKQRGVRRLNTDSRSEASWLLLDFGDVVVHLFEPAQRAFYDLEGLWADAKRISWGRKGRPAAKPKEKAEA